MYYVELHSGTPQAYVLRTSSPDHFPNGKRISAKIGKEKLRVKAIEHLRAILVPGAKVYCILRNVSRSGMSRQISFYIVGRDREPYDISGWVADALDYPWADSGALKVSGGGMDMGFEVVSNLGAALWPNGTPKPHGTRNGRPDSDGGYALKRVWL